MSKITPFLWFNNNAEEAMQFYTAVFKDSKIISIQRYPDGPLEGPTAGFEGKVLVGVFELNGQRFMALDGGKQPFTFNESISFHIECNDQNEVDYYWEKLSAVPEAEQCGWIKDKYGLSWQIVPTGIEDLLSGSDQAGATRAVNAMLGMKKLNIEELRRAYDGK